MEINSQWLKCASTEVFMWRRYCASSRHGARRVNHAQRLTALSRLVAHGPTIAGIHSCGLDIPILRLSCWNKYATIQMERHSGN